ncbi:MAG TPA: hypothetical protein VLA74_08095 [Nitrososphaeraceae archaeon]|nr:hypothetical protein [Nitrososphaeraceae archaeon]
MVSNNKQNNDDITKNSYVYSDTLRNLLKDQLRYFQLVEGWQKRKVAGEGDIPKEEKVKLNKTKKYLDRRKVDVLNNHIFRSMANLIVFFDNLAEHPELRDVYEEDVKELLGFSGQNAKEYEDNIVTRLLQSILKWDTNMDPNNFRLELISSIQNVLYNKILYLTVMDENLGDSVTNTIVNPDVGRALIWCRMFSARYRNSEKKREDQAREPNRPINF